MARDLTDIKNSLKSNFMNNETVRQLYGLEDGDEFDRVFSAMSLENLLLVENAAIMILDLEQWADTVENKLIALIDTKKAHSTRWYQQKALDFMLNKLLVPGEDYYDTSDMSESEIMDAKVVRYCAVTESADSSEITVKMATDTNGVKAPLDEIVLGQVVEYLEQIKDAGVKIVPISMLPYILNCEIDVYYDALLVDTDVQNEVLLAMQGYINNLPFNGTYSNMELVNAIERVEGVKVVEHKEMLIYNNSGENIATVNGVYVPLPGYMELADDVTINMKPYVY